MSKRQIIIIGAGYAGLLGAIRLARQTNRQQVDITLVNGGDHFTERIRLHEWLSGKPYPAHSIPRLLRGTGVTFIHARVTGLNPLNRRLTMERLGSAGQPQHLDYDHLVYALGSHTARWQLPGLDEYAHVLEGQPREALRAALPGLAAQGGNLLVVGGGLTSIETASELAFALPGLRVTLLTSGVFGADLSAAGQVHLRRSFKRLGIEVIEGIKVARLEAGRAITLDGGVIPFDRCLWTGGFTAPALARESGLEVNERGQIKLDDHLRVPGYETISAVGDAAAVEWLGATLRMGCVSAMPMGAYVADRLANESAGHSSGPFRFGFQLRCISLGRRDGVVQFVTGGDVPQERIISGWRAALVKELICRYTAWAIIGERYVARLYRWPQPEPTLANAADQAYAR